MSSTIFSRQQQVCPITCQEYSKFLISTRYIQSYKSYWALGKGLVFEASSTTLAHKWGYHNLSRQRQGAANLDLRPREIPKTIYHRAFLGIVSGGKGFQIVTLVQVHIRPASTCLAAKLSSSLALGALRTFDLHPSAHHSWTPYLCKSFGMIDYQLTGHYYLCRHQRYACQCNTLQQCLASGIIPCCRDVIINVVSSLWRWLLHKLVPS